MTKGRIVKGRLNVIIWMFIIVLLYSCATSKKNAYDFQEGWIIDSRTNCKVHTNCFSPTKTIKWSGGCVDGKAEGYGIVEWYENGKLIIRTTGGFEKGKLEGQGKDEWFDEPFKGDVYIGEFMNNVQHGKGQAKYGNGDIYIGEYKYGKKNGIGTYYYNDGSKYEGLWKDGEPVPGKGVRTPSTKK